MQTNNKVIAKASVLKKRYVSPVVQRVGRVSGLTLKIGSNTDMQGGNRLP